MVDTQVAIIQASSLTSTPFNTTAFAPKDLVINTTYPYDAYISIYARSNFTKYYFSINWNRRVEISYEYIIYVEPEIIEPVNTTENETVVDNSTDTTNSTANETSDSNSTTSEEDAEDSVDWDTKIEIGFLAVITIAGIVGLIIIACIICDIQKKYPEW